MTNLPTIETQGYKQWTIQGLECNRINGQCPLCSLDKLGISKDGDEYDQNKCYQPQANAVLIAKGIPLDVDKVNKSLGRGSYREHKKGTT